MLRAIIVACAALLLAVQVVRNAAVGMLAASRPDDAHLFWSDHPASEISLGMTEIARAAHDRRAVPQSAFAMIGDAARKEPLASEPFLVRGVQAQLAGDDVAAQRAFEAAQRRNPRSLPAAYFLADRYFRAGDSNRGLNEVAALARLAPYGNTTVAPYLAAYARDPSNWPRLRHLLDANPGLADAALTRLASNPSAVPAVLALADMRGNLADEHWLAPLLNTLVTAGRYDQARTIWARAAGPSAASGGLLYDAQFRDNTAPPPFNWALTSSTVGIAERQSRGRLHVVFYGQEDGILATQLLLLAPGTYRLSMRLLGDPGHGRVLNWSLWCDKADAPIASVTLEAAAAHGWSFDVPASCRAQWLKLSGSSSDVAQQSDVTIAELKLERVAPGA